MRTELEAVGNHIYILPGVAQPRVRVGRKIGVLGIDVVGGHVIAELDEEAFFADEGVQRVKWLHLVELFSGDVAFAQW